MMVFTPRTAESGALGCTPDLKIVETCVDDVFSLIEGKDSFKFERGTLYKFVRNTAAL
ncbi:MAG: hypothetical protein LBT41_04770 [Candidatus Methanoplasma sp.]|jgi:hypothetical protein|nr:hypothetical protein [Candidatus Methanoplasma sp.]